VSGHTVCLIKGSGMTLWGVSGAQGCHGGERGIACLCADLRVVGRQ
jgi:hypothetical protein